mmetsp:Transcript_14508/g.21671  ORF Transcript_14508/g.21671 Transcript_14508/m.21671 type:complete len:246 (+) Transcript_14508:988-1725(+)
MVEGVLGDVGNTSVGVLPNISDLRFDLTDKKLNHGRLSGSIFSDAGNTGRQRHLHRNIEEGWCLIAWVSESTLGHLHECFTLGLDTLDRTRLGELELKLRLSEGEVRTSTGLDLDELIEVTLVHMQLQVLNLHHVGTAVVKETRVVRHHDTSDVGEGVDVLLYPGNVDNIKMVRGLIKKQNIGLLKHGTGKGELHTPSTGESGHSVIGLGLSIRNETDSGKHFPHLLLGTSKLLDLLINEDIIDT